MQFGHTPLGAVGPPVKVSNSRCLITIQSLGHFVDSFALCTRPLCRGQCPSVGAHGPFKGLFVRVLFAQICAKHGAHVLVI